MGGRFDPVHNAHIQTALDVCLQFKIDVLHLVPTFNPPHRQSATASFKQRCDMLKLAVEKTGIERLTVLVDKCESLREEKSYSVFTVEHVKVQFPKDRLYFMMGSDAFLNFDTWYNWQQLLQLCTVVVDQRPGDSINKINEKRMSLLQTVPKANIQFAKVQQLPISSSQIRDNLKQGVDATGMLASNVLSFIKNQKLYQ